MTDHQDEDPKDEDENKDESQSKDQSKEPKTVPLDELVKQRQKAKASDDENAVLKAELAKFKDEKKSLLKKEPKPKQGVDTEDRLSKLETSARNRALANELGLSEEQAEEVAKFIDDAPNMAPEEVLSILSKRDPKKFANEEQAMLQHGQLRPRQGSKPESKPESDWQERLKFTTELAKTDKRAHRKYADNMAGKKMAEAMGWEHKSLPIPSNK